MKFRVAPEGKAALMRWLADLHVSEIVSQPGFCGVGNAICSKRMPRTGKRQPMESENHPLFSGMLTLTRAFGKQSEQSRIAGTGRDLLGEVLNKSLPMGGSRIGKGCKADFAGNSCLLARNSTQQTARARLIARRRGLVQRFLS